jgi:hypothetical protein
MALTHFSLVVGKGSVIPLPSASSGRRLEGVKGGFPGSTDIVSADAIPLDCLSQQHWAGEESKACFTQEDFKLLSVRILSQKRHRQTLRNLYNKEGIAMRKGMLALCLSLVVILVSASDSRCLVIVQGLEAPGSRWRTELEGGLRVHAANGIGDSDSG